MVVVKVVAKVDLVVEEVVSKAKWVYGLLKQVYVNHHLRHHVVLHIILVGIMKVVMVVEVVDVPVVDLYMQVYI